MSGKKQGLTWDYEAVDENNATQNMPELELLRQVVEQNDWHNDDVFQQSWRLFQWIRQLPASLLELISVSHKELDSLLNSVIDQNTNCYTLQALLSFTALIHDVGKAKKFQRQSDGTTQCPGHEAESARMAPAICARFDFSPSETEFITTLVGAHGEPYALLKKIAMLPALQQQEQIHRFEVEHADHLLPLLLLAWGDLVTSHLQAIRPEKYEAVFDFYRQWLQKILPGEE